MKRVLVTGADGQLGQSFRSIAVDQNDLLFHFAGKNEMDLTDEKSLEQYIRKVQPGYLVNCAAYTAVDKAESEKDLAFRINATAVQAMAAICKKENIKFLHISTDYVFDGTATQPYKETDPTNPQNIYGASKEAGEKLCLQYCPEAMIIRVSWLFSEYGNNFVRTMLRLMKEREQLNIVDDQIGSPTYAGDLASTICQVISSDKWLPGIYHYSNEGITTWFRFAEEIKRITGSGCTLSPITTAQYPTPAKRPAYSVLDHARLVNNYSLHIPHWKESLASCLAHLQKG